MQDPWQTLTISDPQYQKVFQFNKVLSYASFPVSAIIPKPFLNDRLLE